jgi:hypothetical protein
VRAIPIALLLALVAAGGAAAHAPGTAVGQAAQALRSTPVSYANGSAVSDLEADRFLRLPGVGGGIRVAVMPPSAAQEVQGGPYAVAAEIAREADVHGTLVVLVGGYVAAWSDELAEPRLRELVGQAGRSGQPATQVTELVRLVNAEAPADSGSRSWAWLAAGAVAVVALMAALTLYARRRR